MMKKKLFIWFIAAALLNSGTLYAQENLFISELSDPLDDYSGRFIELYNAGTSGIDFSTTVFFLSRQSNGGTTWGEVQLSGYIDPGETYVIGGSGFSAIYGFEPDLETGILTGNGDDPYYLFRNGGHEEGILHDIFGTADTDGSGEAWEYTDSRAVRISSVIQPNTIWLAEEWIITSANTTDCDPGIHQLSSLVSPDSTGLPLLYLLGDTIPEDRLFTVPVMIEELDSADNIIAYQFDLYYDTTCLRYDSYLTDNTLSSMGTVAINTSITGIVKTSFMSVQPIEGTGRLIDFLFTSTRTDTASVFLTNAYLNNIVQDSISRVEIQITEIVPPFGRIEFNKSSFRYNDTAQITAIFSEAMHIDSTVSFSLNGAVETSDLVMNRINDSVYFFEYTIPDASGTVNLIFTGGYDLNGNELISGPVNENSFSIIELVPGDVNDDGIIQAYDAALTLQYSVGMDPLPDTDPVPWEAWRISTANVDGSAEITAYDAALILQYSAGIITSFTEGTKKSTILANVRFERVENNLKIYSEGDLLGLNIILDNTDGIFGPPVFMDNSCISAFHSEDGKYNAGIAYSRPPAEQTSLMLIPINAPIDRTISVSMHINGTYLEKELHLSTGISLSEQKQIRIYPNPASDELNLHSPLVISQVEILSIHGQILCSYTPGNQKVLVDISSLQKGYYILRVKQEDTFSHYKIHKN